MTAPRLQLTLRKPWLGWFPKPTVVVGGLGQPAQWGTGTWQIPADGAGTLGVYLYNRMWKYGAAEYNLDSERPIALIYTAPWLPFLPGQLKAA